MSYDIGYKDGTNTGYGLAINDLERLIIGFKDVDLDAFNETVDTLPFTMQKRITGMY